MTDLHFEQALLPGGWARDVRVGISADGDFAEVLPGGDPAGTRRVAGAVVPGIPNLHSHAFQRAMAGLTECGSTAEYGFSSWREQMYAFLARLAPEDVQVVASQLYAEMLRHGYTAVAEFHYLRNDPGGRPYAVPHEMALRLHEAAVAAGIGLTLLPTLYRVADFGADAPLEEQRRFVATVDEILGDCVALGRALAGDGNRRVGLALHSLRAVPAGDLTDAVDALNATDPTAPIHIHVAEQVTEVRACLSWSGASPVEWLLDHSPVDARWCAVHATHMTGEETRALASSGAVAGLCPTTEANLGDGVFPLASYLVAGGRWGVGSDSHVSVSPAADLRMLEYSQRLTMHERNVAGGREVHSTGRALLEGAWAGGAKAIGRRLGAIRPGFRADLVVLDTDHPALVGRDEDQLLDAWIFSGEDTPVRDVMVGGTWVVRDGRHRGQEEIATAYRTVARRLAAAVCSD
ncbi:MAG: formimidoylglutamate deiminase [Gammaproteobacteria bacterium]|nr:formimidoylglutamate deiminase [Gammaproteobacteria bacterium]